VFDYQTIVLLFAGLIVLPFVLGAMFGMGK
jgi:hypothetical protein